MVVKGAVHWCRVLLALLSSLVWNGEQVRAAGGNVGRWECSKCHPFPRNASCRVSCL